MITQDKIIEWAREAGFETLSLNSIDPDEACVNKYGDLSIITDELTRFARLAMQYQKEKDAQICEELRVHYGNGDPDGDECAAAIRNQK